MISFFSYSKVHITEIQDVQLGCSTRASHSLNRRRYLSLSRSPSISSVTGFNTGNHGGGGGGGSRSLHSSTRISPGSYSTSTLGSGSPQILSASSQRSNLLAVSSSAFTISYGPDSETLELLASSPEEANIWVTGLKCLMAGAQGNTKRCMGKRCKKD